MSFKRSIFAAIVAGAALTATQAAAQILVVPAPNYHTIDWCAWETISESQAQEVFDQYYSSHLHISAAIRANKAAIAELTSPGVLGVLGGIAFSRVFGGTEAAMQAVADEIGGRLPNLLKFTVNLTRLRQHYAIQRRIIDCMGERLEAFAVAREKRKKFGGKVPGWLPQAIDRVKKVKVELDENGRRLGEIRILVTPLGIPMMQIGGLIFPLPGDVTKIPGMPTTWAEIWRDNPNISWVPFGAPVAWVPVRIDKNGKPYVPADWNKPGGEKTYEPRFTKVYPVGDLVVPPNSAELNRKKIGGQNPNDRGQLNQPTAGAKGGDIGFGIEASTGFKFTPGMNITRGAGTQTDIDGNFHFSEIKLEGVLRIPGIGQNTRIGLTGTMGRGHGTEREGDIAGASTITSINGLNTQNLAAVSNVTMETDYRRQGISFWAKTGLPVDPTWKDTTVEVKGGFVWERESIDQSFRQQVTGNGANFFLHGLDSEIRSNFYGGMIGANVYHRLPGRWLLGWGGDVTVGVRNATLDLTQLPGTFGAQTLQLNDSRSSLSVRTGGTVKIAHDVFDNLRVFAGLKGYWTNDAPYVSRISTPGQAAQLDGGSGGGLLAFIGAKLVFGEGRSVRRTGE